MRTGREASRDKAVQDVSLADGEVGQAPGVQHRQQDGPARHYHVGAVLGHTCGYPPWQILLKVVAPLILPGLVTTGAFVFMEAWNNLIYPLAFVTTLEKQTLPAALVLTFSGQFKTDWGGMMAAATVTTVPLMIAFFAVQRSMIRGLTSGAVAGA